MGITKPYYADLPLMPDVIADRVCYTEYTGSEMRGSDSSHVRRIEALRQAMTAEQIALFVSQCDQRCRNAYAESVPWFMRCLAAKDNSGRDQLYAWTSHWLAAFLTRGE